MNAAGRLACFVASHVTKGEVGGAMYKNEVIDGSAQLYTGWGLPNTSDWCQFSL